MSLLPVAFAEDEVTITITINEYGVPTAAKGEGWSYDPTFGTLTLDRGYIFTLTGNPCSGNVINSGTISNGTISGRVNNAEGGTITGGIFGGGVDNNSGATISGGTFTETSTVNNDGTITDGEFSGTVNNYATIESGVFYDGVNNNSNGNISNGTFHGTVNNNSNGKISNGTFSGTVDNYSGATISGGTFINVVNNYGTIDGTEIKSKLEFSLGGGSWKNYTPAETYNYSSRSGVPLPTAADISKTGCEFAGWYYNEGCTGTPVTEIPPNTIGRKQFYAKWVQLTSPSFTTQPANEQVTAGETATFTVAVSGNPAPTLQWQVKKGTDAEWENIDSATNATYTTPAATTDMSGWQYRCVAANGGSPNAESQAATLTVTAGSQPTPPPPPSYDDDDDDDDDDYTPPKSPAQQAADKIESAQPGSTVELKLPSSGKVDKEVFESLAGNDVTLEITLPGGLTWTVNGTDIPKGTNFSDLNLGVSLGTNGISAEVINKVTGEKTSIQLTLSHNGPFGFALTLTAPLGKENAGFWANLYHFNEKTGVLDYESSTIIGTDGAAALKLTHASQYAIVIDDKSHEPKTPWENPFVDVSENDWFYENVRYSCENGLITGTSATTFAPTLPTTRAMLATILWRQAGSPEVDYLMDFSDVSPSAWYTEAVRWAASEGIVSGYGNGKFGTDDPITREQLAVMLYNYAKKDGDTSETLALSGFADAEQVSDWAQDALRWAVSRGIITGTSATTLTPQGQASRAEAAAMLQRYLDK